MTVRKGEAWGEAVLSPGDLPLVDGDAAAGEWVARHRERGEAVPAFGLTAGDLARTMGGGAPGRFPGTVTRAPVDLLRVDAAGRSRWAIAHVVARRGWWRGEVRLAMNAQFLGRYDVAPRSHPNDGRADVVVVDPRMSFRVRLQARRRARTGAHLPHPDLQTNQIATAHWTLPKGTSLWVDGTRWLDAPEGGLEVDVVVEPDAVVVYS